MTKEQLETYKNTYDRYDGIPNNEFDSICDELIKHKDLEEKFNVNEEDIERALIVKKIIENGYVYYEDDYGENTYYFGMELLFNFKTNEIVLSEEYDDDYFGRWEEIARFPILDYKKKYWLKEDKSE